MNLLSEIFFALSFFHNIILLQITSQILEDRKIKYSLYLKNLISIVMALISVQLFSSPYAFVLFVFWLFCLFFIDLCIFYPGHIYAKISIILFIIINIVSIESFIIVILSLIKQCSIQYIMFTPELYMFSHIVILLIINFIFISLLIFVPASYFKKIEQSLDASNLFLFFEILMIIVIIINSANCYIENFINTVMIQRMIHCIFWIVLLYVAIFIMIHIENHKEHNLHLQSTLKLNKFFQKTFVAESEVFLQVNCNTDSILTISSTKWKLSQYLYMPYSHLIINFLAYNHVHKDQIEEFLSLSSIEHMLDTFFYGNIKYTFECQVAVKNSDKYTWFKIDVFLTKESISEDILAVITVSNISEQKHLLFQAERDQLTGLYNKMTAEKLISSSILKHKTGILFMIDGDHFKQINDILGHSIGDTVIKNIAATLYNIFEPYIIEQNAIVGRMGGDEFMAFVPNKNNDFDIVKTATQVCTQLEQTYSNNAGNFVCASASVGVAEVNPQAKTFKDLYILADRALYASKSNGKNQFTIYDQSSVD
ncbi:MAG: hypothetical protein ATN32_06730 [Candidatus Epulonipiscium fishelsonii]|nr:MAG: hypothetical protein ATN32_06730 [Epulopiscium sp. AS2M-Bin002]